MIALYVLFEKIFKTLIFGCNRFRANFLFYKYKKIVA